MLVAYSDDFEFDKHAAETTQSKEKPGLGYEARELKLKQVRRESTDQTMKCDKTDVSWTKWASGLSLMGTAKSKHMLRAYS
jgi:hypothetical protein